MIDSRKISFKVACSTMRKIHLTIPLHNSQLHHCSLLNEQIVFSSSRREDISVREGSLSKEREQKKLRESSEWKSGKFSAYNIQSVLVSFN